MRDLRYFSQFLGENYALEKIQEINRDIILDYLSHLAGQKLSPDTRGHKLSTISLFFETGIINGWFKISPHLIRKEDYPKRSKVMPRYIPEEVIRQLNQHISSLPDPVVRMILVIQECGLRIGELCQLPFDCLKIDRKEQY